MLATPAINPVAVVPARTTERRTGCQTTVRRPPVPGAKPRPAEAGVVARSRRRAASASPTSWRSARVSARSSRDPARQPHPARPAVRARPSRHVHLSVTRAIRTRPCRPRPAASNRHLPRNLAAVSRVRLSHRAGPRHRRRTARRAVRSSLLAGVLRPRSRRPPKARRPVGDARPSRPPSMARRADRSERSRPLLTVRRAGRSRPSRRPMGRRRGNGHRPNPNPRRASLPRHQRVPGSRISPCRGPRLRRTAPGAAPVARRSLVGRLRSKTGSP